MGSAMLTKAGEVFCLNSKAGFKNEVQEDKQTPNERNQLS
ncbi:hypothetical protein ADIAL_0207 [Alkalibacterium sp. AK22]|nr:hypothetical protein ADIAL_0207 [Alkalibacterium sp. AK22]